MLINDLLRFHLAVNYECIMNCDLGVDSGHSGCTVSHMIFVISGSGIILHSLRVWATVALRRGVGN